jgi:hypothetical protein
VAAWLFTRKYPVGFAAGSVYQEVFVIPAEEIIQHLQQVIYPASTGVTNVEPISI